MAFLGFNGFFNPALATFFNPIAQLAPFSPISALAAVFPPAALSAVSPTLQLFNPAINPRAALLAFDPAAAPALAVANSIFLGFGLSGLGGIANPFFAFRFGFPFFGAPFLPWFAGVI